MDLYMPTWSAYWAEWIGSARPWEVENLRSEQKRLDSCSKLKASRPIDKHALKRKSDEGMEIIH